MQHETVNNVKRAGKQVLAFVLTLLLLWVLAPGGGRSFADGNRMSGACGEHVTWTLAENGTDSLGETTYRLTVSGTGAMYDYEYYSQAGYYWANSQIVSAEIENGVTGIGANAFSYCDNLKTVTIPDSVTDIGKEAFYQCSRLAEISIPNNVAHIGSSAFDSCSRLTELRLPNRLTSVEDHSFSFCSRLTEIVIPDSVTGIGASAFAGCSSLESVAIPDSVQQIGESAFSGCSSLAEVVIPDKVKSIEYYTFDGCIALTEVSIPFGVTEIGESAFGFCDSLADVHYAGTEEQWQKIRIDNRNYRNDPLLQAHFHYGDDAGGPDKPDDPVPDGNPFTDVLESDYFLKPVLWAVGRGITKGTSPTTFSPSGSCTRAQAVTFLWRAAGSEKAENAGNPFTDVHESDYYYDAVLWAIENDVTRGMTADTFGPALECTRGQIVTFLYRSEAELQADNLMEFEDVPENAYYSDAVKWAVGRNVTKGTSDTAFSPDDFCTRGQIVTFLYRALAE
ncbi:MAG: leucine-rich repeat protein [Firmicutes bacterium]|nr:leucine-rich repeat protein [Bacillota bacterium]